MIRRPLVVFVLCWFCGLASGSIASYVPPYMAAIVRSLTGSSDPSVVGTVGAFLQASFLLGWVIGGIVLGAAADRWGRSRTLTVGLATGIAATLLIVTATTPIAAYALRAAAGCGIGGVMVISTTMASVVLRGRQRPFLMGVLANSYAVGIIAVGALQTLVDAWHDVALMLGTTAILLPFLLAIRHVPEVQELDADAEPSFRVLRADVQAHGRELILGSALFGCMLICLWGAFTWLPTWATLVHPEGDGGMALRGQIIMALGLGGIVGSLLAGPLAMRIGRRYTLLVCYIGAIAASIPLYITSMPSTTLFIIGTAAMTVFFGMTQGFMAFYIPELFAHRIRATSVGICFNAGRVITAIAVVNIGLLVAFFGGYREALLVFSAPLAIGLVLTFVAPSPHEQQIVTPIQ